MRLLGLILLGLGYLAVTGCGVKADPQPPVTPIEIGHGHPAYKSEDEGPSLRQQPSPSDEQKDDQDSDED